MYYDYLQKSIVQLIGIFPLSEYNIQCQTADFKQGTCIDIRQCASLYRLHLNPNLSFSQRNHLLNSQCAYYDYPWV